MKFSLRAARSHYQRGEYGPAVANYMGILKLVPANRSVLESEFLSSFDNFAHQLEAAKKVEELNEYFTLISELYPSSPRFLTVWGEFLSRQSLHEEAALCFMRSLDIQPDYGEAKRSLRNLRYGLIDQWHFRMLNDRQRNAAYEQALSICLARSRLPTPVYVLDIGAGTGILSMLALEGGAQKVYACEYSTVMCQMAKKIFSQNGFGRTGEVVLIEKHSKDVKLSEDLNGDRVHLIVTELMDAGFFGEGIVSALLDAKRRLLIPSGGLIIPSRAKIWACLIECETIRRSNLVVVGDDVHRISSSLCASSNSTSTQVSTSFKASTSSCARTSSTASSDKRREPYTSTMLSKIKGGFRYLSQPFVIDEIDLNDEDNLRLHEVGFSSTATAIVTEPGFLDAVACWFEVDLLPSSISKTSVSICTKPEVADSAWEQAIFPVTFTNSKRQPDDKVGIDLSIQGDWLQILVRSTPEDDRSDSISSTSDQTGSVLSITDSSLIASINDDHLFNFYSRFLDRSEDSDSTILDLTDNPRLTYLATSNRRHVYAVCSDPEVESITNAFLKSIDFQRATLASSVDDLEGKTTGERSDFETLLCCPVEACGLLKQNALEDLAFARLRFQISKIVPDSIDIIGILIESQELERYARVVSDQNTLGLKIRDVINVFETDVQRDLELSTLSHKRLSQPTKLMTLDFAESLTRRNESGALPKFLSQATNTSIETTASGTVHALAFWYEFAIGAAPGSENERLSTADPRTHFRVAAALTSPFAAGEGDLVMVQATLERSELYFNVALFSLDTL